MTNKNLAISIRQIVLFLLLTTFFSVVIFFLKNFYGENVYENAYIEEKYIEPTSYDNDHIPISKRSEELVEKIATQEEEEQFLSAEKTFYEFIPRVFSDDLSAAIVKQNLNFFYNSYPINTKIEELNIRLYQDLVDVRGRMKNKKIHLYDVTHLGKAELLAVNIHEFAHFLDLYILKKRVYTDLSDYFYKISWKSTKVKYPGQSVADFVSGYAMTNRYEDFAETFTYYVLHNKDFLEKAEKSTLLKKKYEFMESYIFRDGHFQEDEYKTTKYVKKYYRDTTKIDYDYEKFIKYLQK